MRREDGSTLYSGELRRVDWFSGDYMPDLLGEITIHSEAYSDRTDDAGARLKSGVWLGAFEFQRMQYYHSTVMLPEVEFGIFSGMVERYFGCDIAFSFSFEYPPFEDRVAGQPTKDEFLKGKNLVLKNPIIEMRFIPGPLVRKREGKA